MEKRISLGKRDAKSVRQRVLIALNFHLCTSGPKSRGLEKEGAGRTSRGRSAGPGSREVIAQMSAKRALTLAGCSRGEPFVGKGWLGKSNRDPTFSRRCGK